MILGCVIEILMIKCVEGIMVNEKICYDYVFNSIGIVIALNLYIGYEKFVMIVKEVLKSDCFIYDIVLEKKILIKE